MLEIKEGYNLKEDVKKLFDEYTNLVIKEDPTFKEYLEQQHYEEEINNLSKKYGKPGGIIYVAYYNNELAGCIALKRIDDKNCEMKRLFVRPSFRGKHIGVELVKKVITDAKKIGYKHMLLDTFNFLRGAIKLYEKIGFYETEQYNDSPMKSAVYMKLDL